MCRICDIREELDNTNGDVDMLVNLSEMVADRVDKLEFKEDVHKRYARITGEHITQLEDRVYRLETVLSVMCQSLGIKLVEPLNVRTACNHTMGARSSVLDTHLASWRSLLEAPRVGSQPGSEEKESDENSQ